MLLFLWMIIISYNMFEGVLNILVVMVSQMPRIQKSCLI